MNDFNLVEHLDTYSMANGYLHRPHLYCKDGAVFSVQASATHYCLPKNNKGPWSDVEVMGFSGHDDLKDPRSVPLTEIIEILKEHRGVVKIGGSRKCESKYLDIFNEDTDS